MERRGATAPSSSNEQQLGCACADESVRSVPQRDRVFMQRLSKDILLLLAMSAPGLATALLIVPIGKLVFAALLGAIVHCWDPKLSVLPSPL